MKAPRFGAHFFSLSLSSLLALALVAGCSGDPDDVDDPDAGHEVDAEADADGDGDGETPVDLGLDSLSPESGDLEGGTTVTLSGQGFVDGLTVYFGDVEATEVTRYGGLSAEAVTPAAADGIGSVDVIVENPDGTRATLSEAFTYTEEAVVDPEGTVDYCQLQPQGTVEAEAGQTFGPLLAFVFAEGVTEGSGQGAGIEAELGVGADATDLSWSELEYLGDIDGLSAGDLANDEYGLELRLNDPGDYVYLARFRAADDDDWITCGLEGPLEADPGNDDLGRIEISEPVEPSIQFCQTETDSISVEPGEETSAITGIVFAFDITPGEGQGDGIDGRILYGPHADSPSDWTDTVDADYLEDVDGLSPGDLSNDRYSATLTIADEGEYGFIFQFRLHDGDWVSCGTDESYEFNEEAVGHLEVAVAGEVIPRPENCGVQFPMIAESMQTGDEITLYGRIFEPGLTDQADLPDELLAEALLGPADANPEEDFAAFTVLSATRNPDYIGDDFEEFETTFTISEAGTHAYVYRFSLDDGDNWTYCGIDSLRTEDDIDPTRFGAIVASDDTPEPINYCHTWPEALTGDADADGPEISMEIFHDGVTNQAGAPGDSGELEVEGGFGLAGTNPALSGYHWTSLAYAGTSPGPEDNHEFEGLLYEEADAPAAGDYHAITRARLIGEETWTYCTTDQAQGDFLLDPLRATTLEVQ